MKNWVRLNENGRVIGHGHTDEVPEGAIEVGADRLRIIQTGHAPDWILKDGKWTHSPFERPVNINPYERLEKLIAYLGKKDPQLLKHLNGTSTGH